MDPTTSVVKGVLKIIFLGYGQDNVFQRVQVKILLRHLPRIMWFPDPHRQEKRPIVVLAELVTGPVDNMIVSHFFVGHRHRSPRPPTAFTTTGSGCVVHRWRINHLIWSSNLEGVGNIGTWVIKIPISRLDLAGGCPWWGLAVINLSSPQGFITTILEKLLKGFHVPQRFKFPPLWLISPEHILYS